MEGDAFPRPDREWPYGAMRGNRDPLMEAIDQRLGKPGGPASFWTREIGSPPVVPLPSPPFPVQPIGFQPGPQLPFPPQPGGIQPSPDLPFPPQPIRTPFGGLGEQVQAIGEAVRRRLEELGGGGIASPGFGGR